VNEIGFGFGSQVKRATPYFKQPPNNAAIIDQVLLLLYEAVISG
jgi:hypothetical protein